MPALFVDPNIAIAKTLSTDFYTDPKYFEKAKEKIFSRSWQFIGDTSFTAKPGQCFPLNLLESYLDEPLVITKDKELNLHCLSNVCTHRGNLLVGEPCLTSNIRCKYHGRLFQLTENSYQCPNSRKWKIFRGLKMIYKN
jgi:choline monooxygenase